MATSYHYSVVSCSFIVLDNFKGLAIQNDIIDAFAIGNIQTDQDKRESTGNIINSVFRRIQPKNIAGRIVQSNKKEGLFHGKHPITRQSPGLKSEALENFRRAVMLYAYGSPTGEDPWVPQKRTPGSEFLEKFRRAVMLYAYGSPTGDEPWVPQKREASSRYSGKTWGSPYVHIEV